MPRGALLSGSTLVGAIPHMPTVKAATVTLAQLNAGHVVVPGFGTNRIRVIGASMTMNGAFTTSTDIRISTTEGTPSDLLVLAIAGAADDARVDLTDDTDVNVTITADNIDKPLAAGTGIQIRETGAATLAGTDIEVVIQYVVDSGLQAVDVL